MVSPKELEDKRVNDYNAKLIEETIDAALLEDYKNDSYHKVVINEVIPASLCRTIAEKYHSFGWSYVYYSVNNDNTETTLFILSEKEETKFENTNNYVKVWKGFRNQVFL